MDVDSQVSITSFGEELIHRVCETFFAASKLVFGFLFGTLAVMALIGAALTYPMETACVAAAASFFSIISLRKAYKAGLELRLRSYAATGSSDYGFGLEIEGVTDLNGKMTALLKGREPQVFEVDGTYLERVVLEELTRL